MDDRVAKLSTVEYLIRNNIELVEWTLQDPEWQPSRSYVEKLLSAYKEQTGELLSMLHAEA